MEAASSLDAASRREPMTQKRIDLPRPVTEAPDERSDMRDFTSPHENPACRFAHAGYDSTTTLLKRRAID